MQRVRRLLIGRNDKHTVREVKQLHEGPRYAKPATEWLWLERMVSKGGDGGKW
jgi:hypothetical protein